MQGFQAEVLQEEIIPKIPAEINGIGENLNILENLTEGLHDKLGSILRQVAQSDPMNVKTPEPPVNLVEISPTGTELVSISNRIDKTNKDLRDLIDRLDI